MSILYINEHFADREIFSLKKMERVFWLKVSMYRTSYQDMMRVQGANEDFDPAVNRYIETLRFVDRSGVQTGKDSRTRNGSRNSGTTTVHAVPDKIHIERQEDLGSSQNEEMVTFLNRVKEISRDGSRTLHRIGDAIRNFVKDAPGSFEATTHKTDTSSSTKRSGKLVVIDESNTAESGVSAEKAAPMTAINLQRASGNLGPNGAGAFSRVADGSLGEQDWTSASGYSERAGQAGTSARHEEGYEGDDTVVSTVGDSANNLDRTEFGREKQTATDLTEEETFSGWLERQADNGAENRISTIGARLNKYIEDREQYYGAVTVTENGSDNSNETGDSTRTDTGRSIDWYRHTGRDGLTPQRALAEALQYLADYPDAILWFISKLEPCFIAVLEEEEDDYE